MGTTNNLYIDQGSTFNIIIQVFDDENGRVPLDLSNATVSAQMRKSYQSQSVAATFDTSIVVATEGTIRLKLDAEDTANIRYGRYVYDVLVTNVTGRFRASEGIATVYPSVTKV